MLGAYFNALTVLVGQQQDHHTYKNLVPDFSERLLLDAVTPEKKTQKSHLVKQKLNVCMPILRSQLAACLKGRFSRENTP